MNNAWIAVDHALGTDRRLAPYTLVLKGDRSLYQAIAEDDWVLVLNRAGEIVRAGRVLRLRSDLETTTIFFDRLSVADATSASRQRFAGPAVVGQRRTHPVGRTALRRGPVEIRPTSANCCNWPWWTICSALLAAPRAHRRHGRARPLSGRQAGTA
jgi:hypothetical protein